MSEKNTDRFDLSRYEVPGNPNEWAIPNPHFVGSFSTTRNWVTGYRDPDPDGYVASIDRPNWTREDLPLLIEFLQAVLDAGEEERAVLRHRKEPSMTETHLRVELATTRAERDLLRGIEQRAREILARADDEPMAAPSALVAARYILGEES